MIAKGQEDAARPKSSPMAARRPSRPLILLIFLIALVPILSVPVFPTIDLYNHLARYFVLSHLDRDSFLAANYTARWSLLPNIGLDILGTGMMRVADPAFVARVIIVVVFAVQYFGVLFFSRQLTGRASPFTALLAAPLLYSFILSWGFANFLLGLGLVFWAAGLWLALRNRPIAATVVGCFCAVLIFLTHGVAFALYGLLAGALEIGRFFSGEPGRVGQLARGLALLAVQAVLPVLLFCVSATAAGGGITNAGASVRHLVHTGRLLQRLQDLAIYRTETIYRVAETPSAGLDAISFVLVLAILGTLFAKRRVQLAKAAWPAVVVGFLLVALVPPALFGVGYIADRMPLFLAFVIVGALVWHWRGDRWDRLAAGLLVGVVALRMLYIGIEWQAYRSDLAAFEAAARSIPAGSLVAYVDAGKTGRFRSSRRCEMYGPLLVSEHRNAVPLFAIQSQQPLQLSGPLHAAVKSLPSIKPADRGPAFNDDLVAAAVAGGRFDYAMVCDAGLLTRRLPGRVINQTERFTVLQAND